MKTIVIDKISLT